MLIKKRRAPAGNHIPDTDLCRGPGNLSRALGITLAENQVDLVSGRLVIEDRGVAVQKISWGPRIGIRVGVEKPWRCWIASHPAVSGPRIRGVGRVPRRGLEPSPRGPAHRVVR